MASYSFKLLTISVALLFLTSCAAQTDEVSVGSKLYAAMLDNLLKRDINEVDAEWLSNVNHMPRLLDTRSLAEFNVSHIPGADYVGYDDFDLTMVQDIPKSETIVLYCSVGYRSEKITSQLLEAGYKNVFNLYGGIFEWKNIGQEVVDLKGVVTDDVHAFDKVWGIWLKEGNKIYTQ